MIKAELAEFIKKELTDMVCGITKTLGKNVLGRQNNVFHNFAENSLLERYMAVGRSFDSQLGNRLQRIALFLVRKKFGIEAAPNYVFLTEEKDFISWRAISIIDNELVDPYATQRVYFVESKDEYENEKEKIIEKFVKGYKEKNGLNARKEDDKKTLDLYRKFLSEKIVAFEEHKYEKQNENILKGRKGNIPIDLMYFVDDVAYTYEIKAGGNLDTKNKDANANEVIELLKLFSFFPQNYSYFATCYNNKGEDGGEKITNEGIAYRGNRPEGAVFNVFNQQKYEEMRNRIIVGSVFWEQILPDGLTYKEFIETYREVFAVLKIEERLQNA